VSIEAHEVPDVIKHFHETCHDMRQPVASVLALAVAALAEPRLPAAARGRLEQIVGQAEWLADMIQAFLRDVNRGEADASDADFDVAYEAALSTDIVSIVNEIVAAGFLTCPCAVKVSSPAEPVRCRLHPVLLRRIVSNLISNATRAAGPFGLVTVEIQRRKGLVALVVEDSGPGFGKIPRGTGLGLPAMVRHIVRHGGTMECGHGAGGGALVTVCLPQA
jgi:signal transduction histidine kinase